MINKLQTSFNNKYLKKIPSFSVTFDMVLNNSLRCVNILLSEYTISTQ